MNTLFETLILYIYNNIFFVLVLGIVCYYLIFKRWIRIFEIEPHGENETESRSDDTAFCSSPNCVRCNLYRKTINLANERLEKIRSGNEQIVSKCTEALAPFPNDTNSTFAQNPNVFYCRELQSAPFWDTDMFEETIILESNFDRILPEFESIVNNKSLGEWKRNDTSTGSWEVFHIINQGAVVEQNAQQCPVTMSIISELPSVMTKNVFGNVSFSVVQPSTVISEHYGPTNTRLRCHLGLVCDPTYSLSVSDETRTWETGKTLVFDDSFLHSVYSSGDGPCDYRAVLIVDIWHPDVTRKERDIIDVAFFPADQT